MEDESMEKSIKIEGMMCGHCSGRVKKCLEATAGIANADVSHETGIALVRMDSDVSDEVLTKIIEDEGYKVLEIK
jgi:Cu2+-exporting ATPase